MPTPWRCRAQYVLTTAPRDITSAVALLTIRKLVAPRCVFFPFSISGPLADKDDVPHGRQLRCREWPCSGSTATQAVSHQDAIANIDVYPLTLDKSIYTLYETAAWFNVILAA
jgi:hypothetical protein